MKKQSLGYNYQSSYNHKRSQIVDKAAYKEIEKSRD